MKAIKLASVFAVSAIAAAVSSTASAEAVFSGDAGLNYVLTDGKEAWGTEGEVNIIIDTGVVYADLDMGTGTNTDNEEVDHFVLDEIYVTQGAVQFGDFDGSIATDAVTDAGVYDETTEYEDGEFTDLGVRFTVAEGFVIAAETAEGDDEVGFAASYTADLDGFTLALSGGSYVDDTAFTLGASADVGSATLMASYTTGEVGEADISVVVLGADIAASDAFSISAQYNSDLEGELDNFEVSAYFTAGDVTYFATNTSGDAEATIIGAYASF